MSVRANLGRDGGINLVRWGFYLDLPALFGRVFILDFGRVDGAWLCELGWRRRR